MSSAGSGRLLGAVAAHRPLPLPVDVWLMQRLARWLTLLAFALLMVIAINWAIRQPLFNLHSVVVQSELARASPITLQNHLASRLTGNFFTLDMVEARAIFEEATWVRRALLQREYPNKLRVHLQEHQPTAYWGSDGDIRMVNSYGEIFEGNPDDVQDLQLPVLVGRPDQSALVWTLYQRLSKVFSVMDGASVEELQMTAQGGWRIRLDNGSKIELGHGNMEDIEARSRRFVTTLTQIVNHYGRPLESADLRYASGYAIRLQGITTLKSASGITSIPARPRNENQRPNKPRQERR